MSHLYTKLKLLQNPAMNVNEDNFGLYGYLQSSCSGSPTCHNKPYAVGHRAGHGHKIDSYLPKLPYHLAFST